MKPEFAFFQNLVADVRRAFPSASVALAGGALRDWYHDRPIKDIDIFIELGQVKGWRQATAAEVALQQEMQEKLVGSSLYAECRQSVRPLREVWRSDEELFAEYLDGLEDLSAQWHATWKGVGDAETPLELTNSKGYSYGAFTLVDFPCGPRCFPIQLVFIDMDPIENIKDHFDFGLSQIWIQGNRLRTTPQFWKDHYSKTITYLPSKEPVFQRRLSSTHRAERLKEKYSDFRFHGLHKITFTPQENEKIAILKKREEQNKKFRAIVGKAKLLAASELYFNAGYWTKNDK